MPAPTAISNACAFAHDGKRGTPLITSAVWSNHSRFRPVACGLEFHGSGFRVRDYGFRV